MTRDEVTLLLDNALDLLFQQDMALVELGLCERAIQFRVAHYMANSDLVRPPLTVDCEYNRHLADEKTLRLPPRGRGDEPPQPSKVFPDILVHERNSDANNVLALEIKRPGEPLARDSRKLRQFLVELHYDHAAHLIVGRNQRAELVRKILWVDAQ